MHNAASRLKRKGGVSRARQQCQHIRFPARFFCRGAFATPHDTSQRHASAFGRLTDGLIASNPSIAWRPGTSPSARRHCTSPRRVAPPNHSPSFSNSTWQLSFSPNSANSVAATRGSEARSVRGRQSKWWQPEAVRGVWALRGSKGIHVSYRATHGPLHWRS